MCSQHPNQETRSNAITGRNTPTIKAQYRVFQCIDRLWNGVIDLWKLPHNCDER